MNSGIYRITCVPTGKFYIGSSGCISGRWWTHRSHLRAGTHCNRYLQNAWNKHKEQAFVFDVVEEVAIDLLLEKEQWWLDQTQCYDRKIGFNIAKIAGLAGNMLTEQDAIDRLNHIVRKYKTIDQIPVRAKHTRNHLNKYEASDSSWLDRQRATKEGRTTGTWYPILEEIAATHGFDGLFDTREEKAVKRLQKIVAAYEKYADIPLDCADYRWICLKRRAKAGRDTRYWYPVLDKIATVAGFDGIFDIMDKEQNAVDMLIEIINTYKAPDNLPKRTATGDGKRHAQWICYIRSGKKAGDGRWYPVLDNIADEYGFSGIFEHRDDEAIAVSAILEIMSWCKEHNCLPKTTSQDALEKKHARWITKKRCAKHATSDRKWFPILDKIAAEHGFEDMFDFKRHVAMLNTAEHVV